MDHTRRIALFLASAVGTLIAAVAVAAPASAQAIEYVALGDSYASGVGTRDYIDDGSDCSRSELAYPALLAADRGADLDFAACSGATTADVLNQQLGSLSGSTDLVTITVGGNDTGWADVVQQCAYPYPWTCEAEIDEAEQFIQDTLPDRLASVYAAVEAAAPAAQVVVLGYPRLFNGEECNFITRISPAEQARLNGAADLLAETIGAVAADHGLTYVDVRGPFDGHAVCDDTEWLNGLSWPLAESFHPNTAGQRDGYFAELSAVV